MKKDSLAPIYFILSMIALLFPLWGQCTDKEISPMATHSYDHQPSIVLGMGCFWGAEKRMGQLPGVTHIEAGYAGGDDPKPSYESILSLEKQRRFLAKKETNHAEVVRVWYDPKQVSLEGVLARFWESHNPTQGNQQGHDEGSNYRSAIYYQNESEKKIATDSQHTYAAALKKAGHHEAITTEIAPLKHYTSAEEYHQNYLKKHPEGYCGLGGLGIAYPLTIGAHTHSSSSSTPPSPPLNTPSTTHWTDPALHTDLQLIAFEAEECDFCRQFNQEIFSHWKNTTPLFRTYKTVAPEGWHLKSALFATPTIVLFKHQQEVARFTGYTQAPAFWKWLGYETLSDEQKQIAFEKGTERPFSGSLLDEKRPGVFVDPVSGQPLFRSGTKFNSHSGWPSFFDPIPGSVTYHTDTEHGMTRTEVRSASSGIHLGHVFDDGPPPTGKRYCINSQVLKFVPDAEGKSK
jgi:peptide methionine sulfoxide reductase msrA/msrB